MISPVQSLAGLAGKYTIVQSAKFLLSAVIWPLSEGPRFYLWIKGLVHLVTAFLYQFRKCKQNAKLIFITKLDLLRLSAHNVLVTK